MTMLAITLIGSLVFAIVAPIIGCLLQGADRIISARMQGRVGPKLLQPYWDVRKLLGKQRKSVNTAEDTYITCALIFAILAGGIFFSGGNFLLCVFIITLCSLFFILAGYCTRSPYAEIGSSREALQVMSYEPMVLMVAVAMYQVSGTFNVINLFTLSRPILCATGGVFIGLVFILTIKLRKSPFDLADSGHHAHQDIVKGVTLEMSGPTLAKVEIMHWCENVMFLGWVGMFFICAAGWSVPVSLLAVLIIWFLEIWIDNNFARVKWQAMLKWAWAIAFVIGSVNIAVLAFF